MSCFPYPQIRNESHCQSLLHKIGGAKKSDIMKKSKQSDYKIVDI